MVFRDAKFSQNDPLLRFIPPAPSDSPQCLCEGEYAGFSLVVFASGNRVIIARRDKKFTVIQTSDELCDEVQCLCWKTNCPISANAHSTTAHRSKTPESATYGAIAASCRDKVDCDHSFCLAANKSFKQIFVFAPVMKATSSMSSSEFFPFAWQLFLVIPMGALVIEWSPLVPVLICADENGLSLWDLHKINCNYSKTSKYRDSMHTFLNVPEAEPNRKFWNCIVSCDATEYSSNSKERPNVAVTEDGVCWKHGMGSLGSHFLSGTCRLLLTQVFQVFPDSPITSLHWYNLLKLSKDKLKCEIGIHMHKTISGFDLEVCNTSNSSARR